MRPSLSVAVKHPNLRRPLLKHPILTTILRHFTAEPNQATIDSDHSPQPPPEPSIETQILHQLNTTQIPSWPTNTSLHTLLFPTPTTHLPPISLLRISRLLKSSTLALTFFHFLRNTAPAPLQPHAISTVFQSVLEHAIREHPTSLDHISQLLTVAKQLDICLTDNSVRLLIKYFSRNGDIRRALILYNEVKPHSKLLIVSKSLLNSLLRVDYIDDALQVLEEMLQPDVCTPPDEHVMDMVFGSFLRRNWRKGVVNEDLIVELVAKFGKHGVFPSTIWLTELIRKFCWSGSSGKAWEIMEGLMELGKVETESCNVLLSRLGKGRDYQKLNLLLKKMKEKNIQPDVRTFGVLLDHLCKYRRMDEALEVFKKIKQGSDGICVEPDVVLYNTLIDGLCKVGRHEEGLGLMEEMKLDGSCLPNVVTYNCLIDGFCKAGEIERACELFDQLKKEGIEPVVITLNSLVDGMCKNGRVNSAVEFFKSFEEKGLKGNAITYTILINAFCYANNIEKALKMYDEMLDCGINPDAIVYYTLISGLAQAGRLDDASFVASKMQETGFSLDIVSYNILIAGFCRKNRLDKAVDILQDMEKAGINPDNITYNTLISYVGQNKDFETARRILRQMIDKGLIPTVVTFGALIHAYCLAGNLDEAMKIFQEMGLYSKVPPNTVIYNTLIDSFCKNGKVELAVSLMDDMKRKGVRANTTTYNAMFKGLWEKNWLEKAYKFMDQMTEQALNPDYITMEILTNWLSEIGEIDKLKSFVQGDKVSASTA